MGFAEDAGSVKMQDRLTKIGGANLLLEQSADLALMFWQVHGTVEGTEVGTSPVHAESRADWNDLRI